MKDHWPLSKGGGFLDCARDMDHNSSMSKETRVVVRFQQGNAVGVIEEPIRADGKRASMDTWTVKIGVADRTLARSLAFPAADFDAISRQLQAYLVECGVQRNLRRGIKRKRHRS